LSRSRHSPTPDRAWGLLALAGLALLLPPHPWARVAGLAALALGLANRALLAPARLRGALLAGLLLTYVVSPYWRLPVPGWGAHPVVLWPVLAVLAAVLAWYHRPLDGTAPAALSGREAVAWGVLLAGWGALQANALFVDVPWRGDEDFHVVRVAGFVGWAGALLARARAHGGVLALAAGVAALGAVRLALAGGRLGLLLARLRPRPRAALAAACRHGWWVGALALWSLLVAGAAGGADLNPRVLVRYPPLGAWLAALPAWDRGAAPLLEPAWVRIAPLVAVWSAGGVVLSWTWRRTRDWAVAGAAAALFLTLPAVVYYGAKSYLEPIMLPLETAVLLAPGFLSAPNPRDARRGAGNAALCLFALLKETAAPLLAVAAAVRLGVALRARDGGGTAARRWLGEGVYVLMLGLTLAPYLLFRMGDAKRGYHPTPAQLLDWNEYRILAAGLWEQAGLLAPLGLAGAVWLGRRRDWARLATGLGVVAACVVFHVCDRPSWLGYARFDLLLLPPLTALALPLVVRLAAWRRAAALGLVAAAVGVNLALCPLDWASGTTRTPWGHLRPADKGEVHYPARAAAAWLQAHRPPGPVVLAEHDFHHPYLRRVLRAAGYPPVVARLDRLAAAPGNEAAALGRLLGVSAANGSTLVVYPCPHGPAPPALPPGAMSGFREAARLTTPFAALVIYARPAGPAASAPPAPSSSPSPSPH